MKRYDGAAGKADKGNEGAGDWLPFHCSYSKEMKQPDTGRPKKFCSDKCRREWWKGHPERINRKESAMYPAVCVRCGKEFLSYGNRKRKYCSHDCYIKARFWEVEDEDSEAISSAD